MFKPYPINSYLRVPIEEVFDNLTPEFKSHLRSVFNAKQMDDIEMEFGACNFIIFHFKGNL